MKKTRNYLPLSEINENISFKPIKVTIEDLKENRDEIIKHILDNTTYDNVAKVMNLMVANLGKATCYIKLANESMAELGLFASSRQWLAEYTLEKNKKLMSIR